MAPWCGGDALPAAEESKVAPDFCGGVRTEGCHALLTSVVTGGATECYTAVTGPSVVEGVGSKLDFIVDDVVDCLCGFVRLVRGVLGTWTAEGRTIRLIRGYSKRGQDDGDS